MKVMIVVTHLLGTGHLTRALTLAEAFQAAGDAVTLVSGGRPVPRLQSSDKPILQLPPLQSDGTNFSCLLNDLGQEADPGYFAKRQDILVKTVQAKQPDVLITELFPFGRRNLKLEFETLLDAARNMARPALISASIRDILAPPGKPKKVLYAEQMIAQYYDAVLVHSDPELTPLELSWPVSDKVQKALHYTGFVAPPPALPHPSECGKNEVIVSAGGGTVGDRLFATARAAATLDADRIWRILLGGHDANDRIVTLQHRAPPNLIVEPVRPDFRQMLHHAAASVSFCGYNTALDLLQTGCPAVLVPFDEGREVEQGIRARALAGQPGVAVLATADLTQNTLLEKVNAVSGRRELRPKYTAAYGAARSVEIIHALRSQRHAD